MRIRGKLAATLVPLALVSVAVMTLLSYRAAEKILTEETATRGRALAASFQEEPTLSEGVTRGDERLVLPTLQRAAAAGAAYAAALNAEGRVVAHTNVSERGLIHRWPDEAPPRRVTRRGRSFLEVAVPIQRASTAAEDIFAETTRTRVGTLVVGVSLSPVFGTSRRIGGQVSAIVAAIMALNLLLALALLRRILAPIGRLAETTRRLAEGELGLTIAGGSTDELGELTASFNHMSRTLAQVTVSKLFLDDILNNMLDGLVVTAPDGTIQMLNPSARRALEASKEQWVGRPLAQLLPEAEAVKASGKEALGGEAWLTRDDGTKVPILFSAAPLKAPAGGWAVTFRDISARKAAEGALAAKADELERSNKELEQFAYVASHDLQEPLRKVASFTQLLGKRYKGKLDVDADEFIGFIIDGTMRMRALIQDLLAYSRAGRAEATLAPVALDPMLRTVLADLEPAIAEAGAKVETQPLPVVMGDRMRLAQVFQNLIGNALKFRAPDRPCVVRLGARQERGMWQVWVEDNGIGIEAQHRERVFVIFQRLHSRAEYPGTGIGLAICRRIVEAHGGRIWAEEPAQGARFVFTLAAAQGGQER